MIVKVSVTQSPKAVPERETAHTFNYQEDNSNKFYKINGKILHDKTIAAAAATTNHFLCNVVKLPITGLPKKKVLSKLRVKKRERWEKGKQRQR